MSACEFEERVAAYASGEADDELAAHLPGCASCRAELEEARVLLRRLAPLGEREPAEGELFFADFTRGVRAQLAAAPAPRARWAWAVAPALCAAATLVWMLAGRVMTEPTPGQVAVAPAAPVEVAAGAGAPSDEDLFEADPEASVAELDGAQLDAVLASLDADGDDDVDADPEATIESLDDDQLDAVAASFTL